MKKLNTAVNTIAEHFAGFALSENLDTNTYTPEKGCLENLILSLIHISEPTRP